MDITILLWTIIIREIMGITYIFIIRISIVPMEKLIKIKTKGVSEMKENKTPVEQLTTKDNGLSSTQEVLYQKEFKRASKGTPKKNQDKR